MNQAPANQDFRRLARAFYAMTIVSFVGFIAEMYLHINAMIVILPLNLGIVMALAVRTKSNIFKILAWLVLIILLSIFIGGGIARLTARL